MPMMMASNGIFGRVQVSRLLVFPIRHSGNREKVKKEKSRLRDVEEGIVEG